jgi:hypothetical protein
MDRRRRASVVAGESRGRRREGVAATSVIREG